MDEKLPFLDAKVREASWFKIKGKRLFLVAKYFERPRDLFDMFANSRKYVMQIKKMENEEKQKLLNIGTQKIKHGKNDEN